jgi:hypothetical protein
MYGMWKAQFHGDPNILGKAITLDGFPYTVIGVMPKSFHLPSSQTLTGPIGAANVSGYPEALVPLVFTKEQLQQLAGSFFQENLTLEIQLNENQKVNVNGNNGRSKANSINDIKRDAMNHPILQKVLDEFSGAELVEIKPIIDKSR